MGNVEMKPIVERAKELIAESDSPGAGWIKTTVAFDLAHALLGAVRALEDIEMSPRILHKDTLVESMQGEARAFLEKVKWKSQ